MANIKFIEDSHTYLTDNDLQLISVSKFTERFKEKVNWDEIASRQAMKITKEGTPTTKQAILNKWAKKSNISREIGTLLHSIKEDELIEEECPIFYEKECKKIIPEYEKGSKVSISINNLENDTVYPELMIYDLEHMICGQSDKVIVVDNTINVWDYKTDNEISFKAFSNKWTKPRRLLPPLEHLEDCNGNIYAIKMSLYMYMLWRANKGRFKPGELIIEHVTLKRDPDNDNIPVIENGKPVILKTEQIKLPYYKKEVMEMLKTIKHDTKDIRV